MEPRLIGISGSLKGTTIPLIDEETIIGREPTNRVALNDPLVSRRHCAIRKADGKLQMRDLESLNGTLINGVPTREKALEHGDRIKIGSSQFIFLQHESEPEPKVLLTDSVEDD